MATPLAETGLDTPTVPDLLDPNFYVDLDAMHEALRHLRRERPVARDDKNGLWAITRHADVVDVERNDRVFVSGRGYRSFESPDEDDMISLDDPRHAEQRKLISRRFTPKSVRALEPLMAGIMDDLIGHWADRGELEVVSELAAPLPARLTAHLLGFPEERWRDITTWSERLMRYDQVSYDTQAGDGFLNAILEFSELLAVVADERRAEPADDLISVWANAEVGGCPMAEHTLINETGLLISGGAETTRTVIARSLATFCEHPDQWEAMAADPALIPGAVEEMSRPQWAAWLWRPVIGSSCSTRRPTGTRRSMTTRTRSTSHATTIRTSPSGSVPTSAWERPWPGSSCAC